MIDVDGGYRHEVRVTHLDKILVKLITTITALPLLAEPTNWSWKDIIGPKKKT